MLRDNTESFAPELSKVLSALGVEDEGMLHGFQLLKFERIDPDVFVWLLRGNGSYVVTLNDGGSPTPSPAWLATWSGGLKAEDLELLLPEGADPHDYPGLEDDYDYVHVYRLPQEYDHCSHTNLDVWI